MRDAQDKASRTHRDISVANILLVKEPGSTMRRGVLIDWETSSEVDESGLAQSPGRAVCPAAHPGFSTTDDGLGNVAVYVHQDAQ